MRRWRLIARGWFVCSAASLGVALLPGCRADLETGARHAPYVARACNSCHDTEGSLSFGVYPAHFALPKPPPGSELEPTLDDQARSRLRVRVDQLCFQCHRSMDPESPQMKGLWLHGPFKAGVCLGCHSPHESKNRRLLLAGSWRELCGRCHPGFHSPPAPPAPDDCASCHSPHAQRGPARR